MLLSPEEKNRQKSQKRKRLPNAVFTLTDEEKEEADRRARSLFVPHGSSVSSGSFVSNHTLIRNSHAWKQVMYFVLFFFFFY